jgi:hypothetical protein
MSGGLSVAMLEISVGSPSILLMDCDQNYPFGPSPSVA